MHSLVTRDDILYIKELSCTKCSVSSVCSECLKDPGALKEDIVRGGGTSDEEDSDENEVYDDEDDGQSD